MNGSPTAPDVSVKQRRSVRTAIATLLYGSFLAYQTLAGGGGWACDEPVLGIGPHISRTDMLANVVAYVPLGFLFVLAALRPGRSPGRVAAVLLAATTLGGVLSGLLEAVQACLPDRVSSLYDLGGNLAGALVGAVVALAVRSVASPRPEAATQRDPRRPLRLLTVAIVVMWMASQTLPWVFSLDVSTVKTSLKALRPLLDGVPPIWQMVRYAAAWLAVACAWRLAFDGRLSSAMGIVTTVAVTLGLQVLLPPPSPLSPAELVGAVVALAVALPPMLMAGLRAGASRWARALMLAASITVVVYELLPGPDPTAAPLPFSWWPLVGLGSMLGAIDYAILFAWFGVVAVVAQVWETPPAQATSIAGWPVAAVVLTFVLEALQTQVPGRSGDVSAPLMTLFAVFAARAFLRSTMRS